MGPEKLVHSEIGHFYNAHQCINRSASWEDSQNGVLGLKDLDCEILHTY